MGEDIVLGKSREIEPRPYRQELERRLRELRPPLARQHRIQPILDGMQMQHVMRRVCHLLLGQLRGPPIRALLMLRQLQALRSRAPTP